MNNKQIILPVLGVACTTLLMACGGGSSSDGGGGDVITQTGIFNDSPVDGLAYSCAPSGQSGTTANGGEFSYVEGDTCTFSLGAVTLGSTAAAEIVTPVELVEGGSPSDPTVVNIVQLLTTADDDNDPSNGINITTEVATAAESWSGVDVTSGTFDLDAAVAQAVVDMGDSALVDETTAQSHIEGTATCVYSGMHVGTYSFPTANISGTWATIVYADGTADGIVDGGQGSFTATYTAATATVTGSGTYDYEYQGSVYSLPVTGTGTASANSVSGTLSSTTPNGTFAGTFSGQRFAGSASAEYRFTGSLTSGGSGVYAIDIAADNSATGKAYNHLDGSTTTLSGTLTGGSLTMTGGAITATGQIDLAAGTISNGTWSYDDGTYTASGSFGGSGCKLN